MSFFRLLYLTCDKCEAERSAPDIDNLRDLRKLLHERYGWCHHRFATLESFGIEYVDPDEAREFGVDLCDSCLCPYCEATDG